MNLRERLMLERDRLGRMEREADKVLDSRGYRSPVDARIIEAQKGMIRRIEQALSGDSA